MPITDPKPNAAIAIQHLDHYFGDGNLRNQVLFDINLMIAPGEIVLMTGPSGSGKTTLLTLVGALRSAQTGSLNLLGRELVGASRRDQIRARRSTGYIFQAHNLHRSLTARGNVRMSLELHPALSPREMDDRAADILHRVGLGDRLDYYPDKLSGGQKQRVAIARALVSHPQIVLADEPTAALDSKTGRAIVDLLHDLAKQEHCTILLVTHDNRILDVADRIVHLEDGHLSETRDRVPASA
jgi:putative ABC transport system ATP-binding protein